MFKVLCFTFFIFVFISSNPYVSAHQIPLIIHNKHQIFIQEYWHNAKPTLCVANTSNEDEIIQVSKWLGGKNDSEILKSWAVNKSTSQCFEVQELIGSDILEFKLTNDTSLGLMKIQQPNSSELSNDKGFLSFKDLNNSCSSPTISVSQSSLVKRMGTLNVLNFIDNDVNSYIELQTKFQLPLPQLQLSSVVSESYTINKSDNVYILDARLPKQLQTPNISQLTFETPKVTEPTMFMLTGRKRINEAGWQCFVRGILVTP